MLFKSIPYIGTNFAHRASIKSMEDGGDKIGSED